MVVSGWRFLICIILLNFVLVFFELCKNIRLLAVITAFENRRSPCEARFHCRRQFHIAKQYFTRPGGRISLKKSTAEAVLFFWRYHPDLNWGMTVLQTVALPLGYGTIKKWSG